MRREILLSSLAVGRCFTLSTEAGGSSEETPQGARQTTSILSPADAWKVTDAGDDFEAENAAGESKTFSGDTKVVEIPRQGYDKLVARA